MPSQFTLRIALFISLSIVISFSITSSLAILTDKRYLQSYGTVLYDSSNLKLMGVNHFWWGEMNEGYFELLKNAGGNAWREHMLYSHWRDDPSYWKNPAVTFRSRMQEMTQWASKRGIKIIIMTGGWDSWSPEPSWEQFQADIIMNKDNMGDRWINGWGEVIASLQPYAIDVMNEPMWIYGTTYQNTITQEQFFEAYRQFCMKTIDTWRTIKSDLVCIVNGCPFWDLKPIAANPIPRPNLIYAVHYYYACEGTISDTDTAANKAYYEGRLSEARILLENFLLYDEGIKALKDADLQVLMEETGTCIEAPNWNVFMQDMYDFCAAYNIGVVHHALVPYPKCPPGILNEDWITLNDLGQLWYLNMQT